MEGSGHNIDRHITVYEVLLLPNEVDEKRAHDDVIKKQGHHALLTETSDILSGIVKQDLLAVGTEYSSHHTH